MKAKIDKDGFLYIERAGVMKRQHCPYVDEQICGDWCPLFGEPQILTKHSRISTTSYETKIPIIVLCNKTLELEELTDERKENTCQKQNQ